MRRSLCLLLLLASCSRTGLDDLDFRREPRDASVSPQRPDRFKPVDSGFDGADSGFTLAERLDILFVIDDSLGMQPVQEALVRSLDSLYHGAEIDYRIGVISTDTMRQSEGTMIVGYSALSPFQLQFVDPAQCQPRPNPPSCLRAGPVRARSQHEGQTALDEVAKQITVGTCGNGRPEPIGALLGALDNMREGGCNEGFRRVGTRLLVIIVTTEDDHTPLDMTDLPRRLIEVGGTDVRIASIVGLVRGVPSSCRTENGTSTDHCGGSVCQSRPGLAGCDSCDQFNAPDCCIAEAPNRLFRFMLGFESEVGLRTGAPVNSCQPLNIGAVCRTFSVCEGPVDLFDLAVDSTR